MNNVKINTYKLGELNVPSAYTAVDPDASIELTGSDDNILLYIYCVDEGEITIEGGNGIFAGGSRVIQLPENTEYHLHLETARHVITHEDGRRTIELHSVANGCEVAVIQLI